MEDPRNSGRVNSEAKTRNRPNSAQLEKAPGAPPIAFTLGPDTPLPGRPHEQRQLLGLLEDPMNSEAKNANPA
jgi:hypothetical protein